ncbi:MAG TPA: type III-B CRISPR module-associated Cmr3 family protein [Chloroflexota bacterium]|nr:type III-B CRISPR module-associated Cmr3 family protein [Chloroflexota bacterium]
MILFLEPIDVWLFRDGRPFDALSDHRAESRFPPYPTVLQGAIRSHHLVVQGINLRDAAAIRAAVGTAEDFGTLRLRGPFVARREGARLVRYLPQPADAVALGEAELARLPAQERDAGPWWVQPAASPRAPGEGLRTSAPTPRLLGLGDAPRKGREGLWLAEDALRRYLRGEAVAALPRERLVARESRLGIARDDNRRTTRQGALYEVEFVRPAPDVGLLVEVEGYAGWPPQGLMRLGGEGHGARFAQVGHAESDLAGVRVAPWPAPPDPLPARFKVYFATPTYFAGGWQPAAGDWSRFFAGPVELVAAAVGRYESVGGFDLARNGHKPARRYVPAGSVYYFAAQGPARLRPELVQGALTEWGAEIGLGQIIVEEWQDV